MLNGRMAQWPHVFVANKGGLPFRGTGIRTRATSNNQRANNQTWNAGAEQPATDNMQATSHTSHRHTPHTHTHPVDSHAGSSGRKGRLPWRSTANRTPATSIQHPSSTQRWNAGAKQLATNKMQATSHISCKHSSARTPYELACSMRRRCQTPVWEPQPGRPQCVRGGWGNRDFGEQCRASWSSTSAVQRKPTRALRHTFERTANAATIKQAQ